MKQEAGKIKIQECYEKQCRRLRKWGGRIARRVERVPMKRMTVYAAVLLVLSLIPLLLLGRYNVMCIDDYDYGRAVHDTWLETGSLWQSVRTAWRQNMEFYQNWQGTYISCFLMALCPMNFRYDTAYVVPLVMIGMFAVSTFVLGRHILHRWLGCDKTGSSFVMLILLFLFYQVMEAPFEGIYWYNGSTHYIFMESVWFFTLTALSASLWSRKKSGEIGFCILAALLSVIVGGGNLVTGLQAEILMVLVLLYTAVANRRKLLTVCVPLVTGSVGFLFNVMAPGNAVRSELDPSTGYSAVASVLLSFYHAAVFMIRWTPAFAILIWLSLLPVLWKLTARSKGQFRHPVWVTLGAYCVIAAMFTPTLYAVGMVGLARVDNIIQMVYYLCLVMATAYWLGYFNHREAYAAKAAPTQEIDSEKACSGETAGEALGRFLEKTRGSMTAVCLCTALLVWVLTADKNTYASISALRSLVNGDAQTFYTEAMERYEIYTDEDIVDVEVKPYSAKPALFSFDDLSEDGENWLNLAVMQYYHKAYVRLAED
ncbi:MAG: DUF6056 family protein [Clostridiales bacterium]|nr:DUF6056 family protein [Clostridiales bacterium]